MQLSKMQQHRRQRSQQETEIIDLCQKPDQVGIRQQRKKQVAYAGRVAAHTADQRNPDTGDHQRPGQWAASERKIGDATDS